MKLLNIISKKFDTNLSINLEHVYAVKVVYRGDIELSLVAYISGNGSVEDNKYCLISHEEYIDNNIDLDDDEAVLRDEAYLAFKRAYSEILEFMSDERESLIITDEVLGV